MKRILLTLSLAFLAIGAMAQEATGDEYYKLKLERRQNLTIKEWNTNAKTKTRYLDHETTYDSKGRKVSEAEYNPYGLSWRETYEYGANDRIVKEVRYDNRNKPKYIRKYEYNDQNRKAKQYNYAPTGKLITIKVFEYIVHE